MIFCYSATGNTRYVADMLAVHLETEVRNILDIDDDFPLSEHEPVGLMFPIYCWGVPPVVREFTLKLAAKISRSHFLWLVCTCGDEAGIAMKRLDDLVKKVRGRGADAIISVIMPNTYVMLPGFDVDKPEIARKKVEQTAGRVKEIARCIKDRQTGIYDVTEGSLPGLRSAIFPIFEKWGVNTKWWKVSDTCIGCGRCAKGCPASNIRMEEDRPVWGTDCFSCCACYHRCPVMAIAYASFTRHKSQYHGPYSVLPENMRVES